MLMFSQFFLFWKAHADDHYNNTLFVHLGYHLNLGEGEFRSVIYRVCLRFFPGLIMSLVRVRKFGNDTFRAVRVPLTKKEAYNSSNNHSHEKR